MKTKHENINLYDKEGNSIGFIGGYTQNVHLWNAKTKAFEYYIKEVKQNEKE